MQKLQWSFCYNPYFILTNKSISRDKKKFWRLAKHHKLCILQKRTAKTPVELLLAHTLFKAISLFRLNRTQIQRSILLG